MFGAVQFSNVLILPLLCVQFIKSSKGIELPSVWERAVILLFVKIRLSIFPFDVWNGLWVQIRPVPEVSLLL